MWKIFGKYWAGLQLYTNNATFAQNSLIYPKLQHSKDCFTKIWIAICESLSKYEIMPKIAKKYWVHPELYRKNAMFGPNLPHLPKISKQQRLFYQSLNCHLQKLIKKWNYAKNNYKTLCSLSIIHQKYPIFGDWYNFFKKFSNHQLSFLNLYQYAKN